ncbi:tyrosinase family protein [Rhizobium sp. J15]|uniref:tyrosinase family protein n=1 Tax=Rhizobium sp. J15 TaxID=2035450 RepID=UPI00159695E1|nr:tyrosinase family protein [Rhizobium sp. J15]
MLELYREAVKLMRDEAKFPRHDPRSWKFQANIHWVHPDDDSEEALQAIFSTTGLSPDEAEKVLRHRALAIGATSRTWSTCQHVDAVEYYFLGWHRLYLWHFEQIVSSLVGQDFALPYWDYGKNGSSEHRALPIEFRESIGGSQAANPLWYEHRNPEMNKENGAGEMDPADVSPSAAFQSAGLYLPDTRKGFNSLLNTSPHGNVHVAIGGPGEDPGMGTVPTAGRDPVFWVHHCNIDRLWEIWRRSEKGKADETTFRDEWKGATFAFSDPMGELSEMEAARALDLSSLSYDYDDLAAVVTPVGAAAASGGKIIAHLASSVPMEIVGRGGAASLEKSTAIGGFDTSQAKAASVELEVRARGNPGDRFDVYLAFPKQAQFKEKEVRVGRFNVFGATTKRDPGGATFFFSLDASNALKDIIERGLDGVTVRVSPATKQTSSPIYLDDLKLVLN